jgi:predicted O-methyltransferase YrrM
VTAARTTDQRFRTAVETLRVPVMGTEAVAPLLTALVRLVRPQRVLEVGMGYTTPFLAATLAELAAEVAAESAALGAKTRAWLDGGQPLAEDWMAADPALLAPDYYTGEYRPRLVAVDDLSIAESSSTRVAEVLRELGLDELATVVNADLRDCAEQFPEDFRPIDFAWVDAWECLYFFDHFWDRIEPDGGIVAMHYLLTYPEGEAFLRYLSGLRERNPGEFEIVNLLEPHKLTQNSVTIVRKTSGKAHRQRALPGGRIDFGSTLQEVAHIQARQ